jgi:sensor histidine kinase YesM
VLVPTLILQPIVENAIRHGLEPLVRPGTLTIEAEADNDVLMLRVCDDGVGFSKTWARRDGVGLANTRSRLDRLYGERAALTMREQASGGVRVDVTIPLRKSAVALTPPALHPTTQNPRRGGPAETAVA